jgi:hypothetical protein
MKRLMQLERAADYCDVPPGVFLKHCPIKPGKIGRYKVWDRVALDLWIESWDKPLALTIAGVDDEEEMLRLLDDDLPGDQKGQGKRKSLLLPSGQRSAPGV